MKPISCAHVLHAACPHGYLPAPLVYRIVSLNASIPMQFTQIPPDFAPLDSGAVYAFEAAETATHDFRIVDTASGTVLGTKRFHAAASGRFDIAPYLRGRIRYTPAAGPTGYADAPGRSCTVRVETAGAATPARTFLPGAARAGMALRTSLPRVRLLSPGEREELTLLSPAPGTATLTVRSGGTIRSVTYRDTTAGLRLFRLDTADFPEAETLALAFEGIGEVEYRLVERPCEAQRLAWIGRAGSVEHYTFPVEKLRETQVKKQRIRTDEGYQTVHCGQEVRTTLVSAFETAETAEAIAEILAAPAVWLAQEDGSYLPVDVLTDRAVFRRHGTMCCLEITIR